MATVRKSIKLIVLYIGLSLLNNPAEATIGFNTIDLVQNSMQPKCLDWRVVGVCFWLKCSPKCKIRMTPKISHYLPDYTVTTSPDQCPWQEANLLSSNFLSSKALAVAIKTAGGNPGRGGSIGKYPMKFKESMVVGNPAAQIGRLFNARFLCKSKAQPMRIYFDSRQVANAATWRGMGLSKTQNLIATDIDRMETWTLGSRVIGRSKAISAQLGAQLASVYDGWGGVYPRRGTVLQADDVKAGAVIAQRAIEIVIRNNEGYAGAIQVDTYDDERWESWNDIHTETQTQCQALGGRWRALRQSAGECSVQGSIQQRLIGAESSDQWQMIYPAVESQCGSFDARAGLEPNWSAGRVSEEGAYGYNFWQYYKCCIPRSGRYLFSVEF